MNADILALLDSDPAAGILAAADELEQEAIQTGSLQSVTMEGWAAFLQAIVRRWRGVVERHADGGFARAGTCIRCIDSVPWSCPDLTETADEVRAYLGGAA